MLEFVIAVFAPLAILHWLMRRIGQSYRSE